MFELVEVKELLTIRELVYIWQLDSLQLHHAVAALETDSADYLLTPDGNGAYQIRVYVAGALTEGRRKAALGAAIWSANAKAGWDTRDRKGNGRKKPRQRPDVTGKEVPL